MSRRIALAVCVAGLFALAGGQAATQQLPPGFVDPKPILDAAIKAIGNDKLNCVTISGEGYNGAVGQQKEAGKNVDWPRPDKLGNYVRTMNWQAKTMKEEFDRKPGLAPAAWKYGIGWLDGPLQTQTHQVFMLNASGPKVFAWHMDGAMGQPVPNDPDVAEIFPIELWINPHGFLKASQMPGANAVATWRWERGEMGRDGPTVIPEIMNVVRITAPGGWKIDATINKEHMLQRMHTLAYDPVLGDLNYEHEFTNESYIDVGNGIKFPTGWHSHEGLDDNFTQQTINAGHNAFGGTMKDVKANVCPDAVAVPDNVRNYQPQVNPLSGAASASDLAFATGRGPDVVASIEGRRPLVRDDDVVVFASRDGADRERRGCQPLPAGLLLVDRDQIRRQGLSAAGREAVTFLTRPGGPEDGFWIHLDADVFDETIMQAVDDPRPGGLGWDEVVSALRIALRSGRAVGLQVAIYNPDIDTGGSNGRGLAAAVREALAGFAEA